MPHHPNEDSVPPIQISKSTKVTAPIAIIISFTIATAGVVMAYAGLLSTDDKHGVSIKDLQVQTAKHEERIFKLEQNQTKIDVMQNDITWIRKSLEERGGKTFNPNPGH